jgi:hypothetical protein
MGPRERMCLLLVQTTRCLLWWIVASTDIFRGFGNASGQHPVTSPGYVRKKNLNCLGSLLHILNRVGGEEESLPQPPPVLRRGFSRLVFHIRHLVSSY